MKTAMPTEAIGKSIGRIERREWFLWSAAVVVTLLLTFGLASFLLREDDPFSGFPQAVRGLIGLVLIFDIYTLFQQLQIHRMRRRLIRGEELFRLISENAADMIAVVDMEGKRLFNSFSYERVLGYSLEELRKSSSFEQIHPDDRSKVRQAAEEARRTGVGKPLEYRVRHKDGTWRVLESTASVIRNSKGDPENLVIVNRDATDQPLAPVGSQLPFRGGRRPLWHLSSQLVRRVAPRQFRAGKNAWLLFPRGASASESR